MILEDEVRHHRIFDDLAETMRQLGAEDTKKHIKILKFIRDRSKDQPD